MQKKNIELSEVTCIKTQQIEFKNIQAPSEEGTIVTNPPYGQRLSDQKESDQLYKQMGKLFKSRFKDWSYHILTLSESFEDTFQKRSTKTPEIIQWWDEVLVVSVRLGIE